MATGTDVEIAGPQAVASPLDDPASPDGSADRTLAVVAGVATGIWVSALGAVTHPAGVAVLLVYLLMTGFFVTASVWLALIATRSRSGSAATLTRVAVAAGTSVLVAAATEPMRLLASPSSPAPGSWGTAVLDVLATTALVMLPVANVVADRQARARQGKN